MNNLLTHSFRSSQLKKDTITISSRRKSELTKLKEEADNLWAKRVKERDGYICQLCSHYDRSNHAHHIITRKNWSVRWHINNGITLCYNCHMNGVHSDTIIYAEKVKLWLMTNGKIFDDLKITSHIMIPKPITDLFYKKIINGLNELGG